MTTGDNNLRTFIEGQGHSVFTRAANASEDLIGAQAVVISESCASGDVTTKYSGLPVPAMTMEQAITDDWNLASGAAGTGSTNATIVTEDARYTGSLTIAGSPYAMGGAVGYAPSPCSGATVLADDTTSGEPCYFYVPRYGTLISGVAAHLRIFLGLTDALMAAGLSSDGQQMLFGALRELYKATMQPRSRVFFIGPPPQPDARYIRSNGGMLLATNNGRVLRAA